MFNKLIYIIACAVSINAFALTETTDVSCGGPNSNFEIKAYYDLNKNEVNTFIRLSGDFDPMDGDTVIDGFTRDVCAVQQMCKEVSVESDGRVVFPEDKQLIPDLIKYNGEYLTDTEKLELDVSTKHDIHTQTVSDCAVLITSNENNDRYITDVWGQSSRYGYND